MNIECRIPINKIGDWTIEEYIITESAARLYNINCHGRPVESGTYKKLTCNGSVVMSNTPIEIEDSINFIDTARGHILIAGLGLGVVLEMLIEKKEIKSITVIEIQQEVLDLVTPSFTHTKNIEFLNTDIFKWKPGKRKFDFGWFDIWQNICGDNLEEISILRKKYANAVKKKYFWCEYECKHYR